jgi:hypothetical protein
MKLIILYLLILTGCSWIVKQADDNLDPVPDLTTTAAVVTPQQTPQAVVQSYPTLPYMTKEQSKLLLDEIRAQFAKLKLADRDMSVRFCPNYYKFNDEQKIVAWGYVANAIIQYESGTDDGLIKKCVKYTESNGEQSIGFFQLSYGNQFCPMSKAEGDLCDTKVNILCGVKIMGKLVAEDQVVTDGGYIKYGAKAPRGLAKYWSVTRVPDKKSDHHLRDIMDKAKKAPGC